MAAALLLASALCLLPFAFVTAQVQAVTVGTAVAARGTLAYGDIVVPAGADVGTTIPVAVVNGARPGKTVLFLAGSHGTEYASVVALTRLIGRIDPASLTGTVVVIPLLNVASFEQMTVHVNPIDKKGMNAGYPGNAGGTQTERALALVTAQAVDPADVVVDLHGGDLDEDLRPYSYWTRTGRGAQDDAAKALVLAFGLDHIILRDIDTANPASTRSLGGYALSKGKTTIIAEAGRSGLVLDADVDALVNGSLNVLGELKMLARPVTPLAKPVFVEGGSRVAAEKPGLFTATVPRDTVVKAGDVVGYLTDYVGRRVADIKAPVAGLVTFIRGVPSVWVGATLVNVSPILTSVPAYKKPTMPPPTAASLLEAAATYLVDYEKKFAAIVSEELYTQSMGASARSQRRLKSDVLFINAGADNWMGFRDVFEVDGRPVRDRADRLQKIFLEQPGQALEQAARIALESARYNIGLVSRTINQPTMALLYLRGTNQARSTFKLDGRERVNDAETYVLAFKETATPTVIRNGPSKDAPASGRFWVDPYTGRVVKSELSATTSNTKAKVTVTYGPVAKVGIWVPTVMNESYDYRTTHITGQASYSNFRSFSVSTEQLIIK